MEYAELLSDFLEDAKGHLKVFDDALMVFERSGHKLQLANDTLGALHTLKGNSGMMGFESLKAYIHLIEGVLKRVNDGELGMERIIKALFNSSNAIRAALNNLGRDPSFRPDLTDEILDLQKQVDSSEYCVEKQMADISSYLGARTDTIKVDFKRLDGLLNLVGELVILKTRLNQVEGQIRGFVGNKTLAKELNSGLELMGKAISGLQEGIMKVRMLPISHVFNKFPRMVRDLSRAQDKDIRLVFKGEETELDKTVIDELEEPLLHILRNALDHGIETRHERIAKGKGPQGTITLSAEQESSQVIIRVRDDGRGISHEAVKDKAVRLGLVRSEDALDRDRIFSLIFSPGFSTRQEATDVSGRGIGLDVVHKNVSRLNGQVMVDSAVEQGTLFTIKLPLSLAIIPALMAETSGEVYAIPMGAVDESIKVREDEIHLINNSEVIEFREKVIPVVRLNDFFRLEGGARKRLYLVIIGRGDKRLALAVDRLRGQQEIVIKPMDETFGKIEGIAGASILGNGRIVLILDVMSFWKAKELREAGNIHGAETEV